MNRIVAILMRRDGMTEANAEDYYEEVKASVESAVDEGAGLCEIEDIVLSELGLEPDYLEDILMELS